MIVTCHSEELNEGLERGEQNQCVRKERNAPTPELAIARLVLMYARKVRSEARWSLATDPEFSSRKEVEFNIDCHVEGFCAGGSSVRREDEAGWAIEVEFAFGVVAPGEVELLSSKSNSLGGFLFRRVDVVDVPAYDLSTPCVLEMRVVVS